MNAYSLRRRWLVLRGLGLAMLALTVVLAIIWLPKAAESESPSIILGWILLATLTFRLAFTTERVRKRYQQAAIAEGRQETVMLVDFTDLGTEQPRASVTIQRPDNPHPTSLVEIEVPAVHAKCLRIGAMLILRIAKDDPELKRIDWRASEKLQTYIANNKASGFAVINCTNCGAPLKPTAPSSPITCSYCGEVNVPVRSSS